MLCLAFSMWSFVRRASTLFVALWYIEISPLPPSLLQQDKMQFLQSFLTGQVVLTTQFSGISSLGEDALKSITQILVQMGSVEPSGNLRETLLVTGCHPELKILIMTL